MPMSRKWRKEELSDWSGYYYIRKLDDKSCMVVDNYNGKWVGYFEIHNEVMFKTRACKDCCDAAARLELKILDWVLRIEKKVLE